MLFGRRKEEPTPANTTAVILAGGAAERFGAPKGLATLAGRPMVRWSAQLAAAVSNQTILVLAPGEDEAKWRHAVGQGRPVVPPTGKKRPASLHVVHDKVAHQGPAAGVQAALEVVRDPFVLLFGVDMPMLRPDLVLGFTDRLVGHDAVAYHLDGWWRPLPSLWKRSGLALAAKRADDQAIHSLHGMLDLVDARPLGPEFLSLFGANADMLKSINTRDDLAAAERELATREAS